MSLSAFSIKEPCFSSQSSNTKMAEEAVRVEQERNISFHLRMRSVALLRHKGKLGLAILLLALFILSLVTAISYFQKEKCQPISREYRLCNKTLRSGRGQCYQYGQEKRPLHRIYRRCVMDWGQSKRCRRHLQLPGNGTFVIPTSYDHTFYVQADNLNSPPVSVYAVINGTCILYERELNALFQML